MDYIYLQPKMLLKHETTSCMKNDFSTQTGKTTDWLCTVPNMIQTPISFMMEFPSQLKFDAKFVLLLSEL